MDDKWFKLRQRAQGVTADAIAERLGRDRSAVSRIYSGRQPMSLEWARAFADTLDVPVDTVLRKAGVIADDSPSPMAPGLSDGDATPFTPAARSNTKDGEISKALGGDRNGIDVWIVSTRAMILDGLRPGDKMLVDTLTADRASPGDTVIAQHYDARTGSAVTLLRRFAPPVLTASGCDPSAHPPLMIDGRNVLVRGRVVASWRTT